MSARGYWAQRADGVLAGVFATLHANATEAQVRAAVRDAYPFGPREHWPYKAWLARAAAWTAAWKAGHSCPLAVHAVPAKRVRPHTDDGETLDMFGGAA